MTKTTSSKGICFDAAKPGPTERKWYFFIFPRKKFAWDMCSPSSNNKLLTVPIILREFLCEFSWYVYKIPLKYVPNLSQIFPASEKRAVLWLRRSAGSRAAEDLPLPRDSKWLHWIWVSMKLKIDLDSSAFRFQTLVIFREYRLHGSPAPFFVGPRPNLSKLSEGKRWAD